ncbi:MAG TPA: hypothetical protein VJ553_01080, partial [Candidatus Paceibacterota bacterium]|nr:hypothetical protein [Candidatus Paceibacterota bacterium]
MFTKLPVFVSRNAAVVESVPPVPKPPENWVYPAKPVTGARMEAELEARMRFSDARPPPEIVSLAKGADVPIPTFPCMWEKLPFQVVEKPADATVR